MCTSKRNRFSVHRAQNKNERWTARDRVKKKNSVLKPDFCGVLHTYMSITFRTQ